MIGLPRDSSQRLLVLTLAMEQAARDQDWDQFNALLAEREAEIGTGSSADGATLAAVEAANLRMIRCLQQERARMAGEFQAASQGVKAGRAYRGTSVRHAAIEI